MAEQYAAAPAADEDPLELEHMMGFAGDKQGSVTFHPREPNKMISYTGCLLVISDVDDPHKQEFLRGHNEAITCLAVSPSGNLLATGQASTTRVPNSEATVIVWDWQTRQPIYRLMELHDGIQFSRNCVRQLAFSADEAFLAGSDDQPGGAKLCIWQTSTAQLAVFQKTAAREMAFLEWGAIVESTRKINKQPSYKLHAADKEKVLTYSIDFDNRTMQYKMTSEIMQLPSSGLTRGYNCGHAFGSFLIAGSSAGELCVFNTVTQVFRACVPVSKGGLLCLCTGPAPDPDAPPLAYCGCGDGTLKVLQGADLQWVCLAEVTLDGNLMSVTLSADGVEVLVGTSTGNIYRLDAASLTNLGPDGQPSKLPLLASHSKPIRCMGFGESSEWFVTASDSGALRRWELSHYSVDYEIAPPVKTTDATALVRADCLAVRKGSILTGWSDGVIRSYDERDGAFLWEIVSAHRGGVSCIDLTPLYLVSAGQDGSVRVWGESESRSLLGNFDEHSKRVTGLCVDVANPALIHTCAEDKLVVTIDLNQARRTSCHSVKEGIFKSMCQATTGELELVSADTAGNLKWWDCDEVDPVSMMVTWSPHDDAHKERRLTHLEMSPPLAEGTVGSDYLLATTASGDVQVWDLGESTLVSVGTAHSDEVTMARWAPDGKQVVSCGKDACICVWNFYGTAKPPGSIRLPSQQQ